MPDRARLEELRDQALRDLVELERQVADGEIPLGVASELRRRYEVTAARALDALDAADEDPAPAGPRRSRARTAAYTMAAVAVLVATGVLLPLSVTDRPEGGFVTGNEAAAPGPLGRAPATISDAELEAAVAANPDVEGMRLALAERYVERGEDDRAAEHYTEVLRRQPDNPEAQAGFGWLLMQSGRPVEAMAWVQQALRAPQVPLDALWFTANIELYGLDDPAAALATLNRMRQRPDLTPAVRAQVEDLATTARRREEVAPR